MSFRIHQMVVPQVANEAPDSGYTQLQAQIVQLQDQLAQAKAKLAVTPFNIKITTPCIQKEVVLLSVSPCPSPRASPRGK